MVYTAVCESVLTNTPTLQKHVPTPSKQQQQKQDEDSKMRTIRELQEQLQRTEAERASLKAELNTMVSEAINADQELATLQAEVQRLMSNGGASSGQFERTVRLLEEEKAAALNKVSRITAELEDKELEFQRFAASLKDTVGQLEVDKRRMRDEIEDLQRALDDSKSSFSVCGFCWGCGVYGGGKVDGVFCGCCWGCVVVVVRHVHSVSIIIMHPFKHMHPTNIMIVYIITHHHHYTYQYNQYTAWSDQ